jgi:hypothetical protein
MTSEEGLIDQLTTLSKLLAEQSISDEEFQILKARLLSEQARGQKGTQLDDHRSTNQRSSHTESNPAEHAVNAPISDWAAWCLALVPFISIAINGMVLGSSGASILPYLTSFVLWLLFYFIDRDMIKRAGSSPPEGAYWLGILLFALAAVPTYLYRRSKQLGRSLSPFYASVISMALWLLLYVSLLLK